MSEHMKMIAALTAHHRSIVESLHALESDWYDDFASGILAAELAGFVRLEMDAARTELERLGRSEWTDIDVCVEL